MEWQAGPGRFRGASVGKDCLAGQAGRIVASLAERGAALSGMAGKGLVSRRLAQATGDQLHIGG
jgi:hypothetical protein